MKKYLAVLLVCAFLFLVPTTVYALEAFTIEAYDIHMDVGFDNCYEITETIQVTFSENRHGIVRSIPLKTYRGNWASIRDISVEGHDYTVSEEGGTVAITMGSADQYADTNERYKITYVYAIGDDGLSEMDELYFNLIGSEWDAYIDDVSFTIAMPSAFDASRLNITAGEMGSIDNSRVEYTVNGVTITGRMLDRLGPGEALTVALPLPEGYFSEVEADVTFTGIFSRFYWLLLLAPVLFGLGLWLFFGKNRRIFPTVEFYPPKGATPADIGYIIDGRVDPYDITALIIYWADRQYLAITEVNSKVLFVSKKSFILTKLRDMEAEAKDYEHTMFHSLFNVYGDGKQVSTTTLENRFYVVMNQIKSMVVHSQQNRLETRIYKKSGVWARLSIGLLALLAIWMAVFAFYSRVIHDSFPMTALTALIGSAILLFPMWALVDLIRKWKMLPARKRVFGLLSRGLLGVIVYGAAVYFSMQYDMLLPVVFALGAAILLLGFSFASTRRTELGDWYMERLIGFQSFLRDAESDRINALVEENPQYFYAILPYAMVLGVTDKWARNFENITDPPSWYHSDLYSDTFSTAIFVRSMNENMNTLTSSLGSRPSSSGSDSSSGGSAGGGSGGGGGSSW